MARYRTVLTARTARTHRPADGPSRSNPIRDDGLTRWRETHQMKKEYLVLTIILAISLIVTLVLLIGTQRKENASTRWVFVGF